MKEIIILHEPVLLNMYLYLFQFHTQVYHSSKCSGLTLLGIQRCGDANTLQRVNSRRVLHPTTKMSDFESDIALPTDFRIEDTLRAIVARLYNSEDHENLTIKRVRKAAEVKLELPEDYLKENAIWKSKSKDIIADEHVRTDSRLEVVLN